MTRPDRAIRRSVGRIVDTFCERLRKRTTPDFIAAFGLRLPRSQKASLLPLSPSMRVWRSTVYRWIARYLAERAPCSLADGERSGRSRMTPAPTHAVQQILAQVSVAAHLATYLVTSLNWASASTDDAMPESEVGVHIHSPGIGCELFAALERTYPALRSMVQSPNDAH